MYLRRREYDIADTLKNLPEQSGVYLFKDKTEKYYIEKQVF